MKTKLCTLKTYVGALILSQPTHNYALAGNIKVECEYLKTFLFTTFNDTPEEERFADILNWYWHAIIKLSNTLFKPQETNPVATQALHTLVGLLRYLEQEYGFLLNRNHPLPAFEVMELHRHLKGQCRQIAAMLEKKHISETLLRQLLKALEDPFRPYSYPKLCYGEKYYLEMFIQRLKTLAVDHREKDWNMRLKQLLLKYNFNHMGIYKVLANEQENKICSIKSYKKQLQLFYEKTLWLEQLQVLPDMAYNKQAEDLKTMLVKHINILKAHTEEEVMVKSYEDGQKLRHNLSLGEMALEFHYKYGLHVYDYPTKKAAVEVYCNHNRSIGTEHPSLKSFLNFDKIDRNAAIKYYQRNNSIQKKLVEDFDL